MRPQDSFPRKHLIIIVMLAVLPAVVVIGAYLFYKLRHNQSMAYRLTPRGITMLSSADSLYGYRVVGKNESTTSTQRIEGYPVLLQSPQQDAYFVMRLRKALLAQGNTSDDRSPCSGQPQLAFQMSDDISTVTVLLNLVCRNLQVLESDAGGKTVAEGRATLSPIGVDQLRFLEAETFQPK